MSRVCSNAARKARTSRRSRSGRRWSTACRAGIRAPGRGRTPRRPPGGSPGRPRTAPCRPRPPCWRGRSPCGARRASRRRRASVRIAGVRSAVAQRGGEVGWKCSSSGMAPPPRACGDGARALRASPTAARRARAGRCPTRSASASGRSAGRPPRTAPRPGRTRASRACRSGSRRPPCGRRGASGRSLDASSSASRATGRSRS
jgi:hypothetical protein